MPTVAVPRALLLARPRPRLSPKLASAVRLPLSSCPRRICPSKPRLLVLVASSAASFDELDAKGKPHHQSSKKSILSNLIQEIEPLDVNLIQKDVPTDTVDAMKRTISGMLGLLPSDQFNVLVEAFWESLFKLLVSSMMTGYTLRNAEYRLCLERNLDIYEEHTKNKKDDAIEYDSHQTFQDRNPAMLEFPRRSELMYDSQKSEEPIANENMEIESLGEMSDEAKEYILYLQSRLSSVKKELHDTKRENAAVQMQQFVGEEKNDLLDYLRSLQPEKVAQLSEPTCPGLQEIIHSVAHGLLATLSPRMHTKAPPQTENAAGGILNIGKDDCTEVVENASLQFQPLISVSRDYLARLLFWCMLLGHYLRGLEYRLELAQLLTISGDGELSAYDGDYVS